MVSPYRPGAQLWPLPVMSLAQVCVGLWRGSELGRRRCYRTCSLPGADLPSSLPRSTRFSPPSCATLPEVAGVWNTAVFILALFIFTVGIPSFSSGDFWLGLEKIHQIMQEGRFQLLIELQDWEGNSQRVQFLVSLGGEDTAYTLSLLGPIFGELENAMGDFPQLPFSTRDQDHDLKGDTSCAKHLSGEFCNKQFSLYPPNCSWHCGALGCSWDQFFGIGAKGDLTTCVHHSMFNMTHTTCLSPVAPTTLAYALLMLLHHASLWGIGLGCSFWVHWWKA